MQVGAAAPLRKAQVGLTSYKQSDLIRPPGPWRLTRLARSGARVRLVGDCVQYALLCRGQLDACVDPAMKPWDIGALAICVLEAGGSVSDLTGATARLVERSSLVAASSASLRRAIVAQVGEAALMAPRIAPRDRAADRTRRRRRGRSSGAGLQRIRIEQ